MRNQIIGINCIGYLWSGLLWLGLVSLAAYADGRPAAAQDAAGPNSRLALWRSLLTRPDGTDTTPVQDRLMIAARVGLGARLFADVRLSGPGDRSCASCHRPKTGFSDGFARGMGRTGPLPRNTPTLWNVGHARRLHWDGSERDLANQARRPIENTEEMAGSLDEAVRRLATDASMRAEFAAAFIGNGKITPTHILDALASYTRTLVSPVTRFDRWIGGEDGALDAIERAGFDLFVGLGRCATCHAGWRFTDDKLHDIGRPAGSQQGWLTEVKTPTLRELVHTAPYMHDGGLATLNDVVRHYGRGIVQRGSLSPNIARGLALEEHEIDALVAFLKTLSSEPVGSRPGSQ